MSHLNEDFEGDKMKKRKVGLIYGCFDLFHVGHLNALKQARRLCDILLVGIFTDEAMKSYKHKPIISFEERAQIIAELRCVDAILKIKKREPQDFPEIDFLFVSNKIYGDKLQMVTEKWEGQIIYIPYFEDTSTTDIIKKILKEKYGRV